MGFTPVILALGSQGGWKIALNSAWVTHDTLF